MSSNAYESVSKAITEAWILHCVETHTTFQALIATDTTTFLIDILNVMLNSPDDGLELAVQDAFTAHYERTGRPGWISEKVSL